MTELATSATFQRQAHRSGVSRGTARGVARARRQSSRWLLFDAPKQHELSQADFDAYTNRLQLIAEKYPGRVQIVFSVADLKTQFQASDERGSLPASCPIR
jgi:hypothetical protein